MGKDVLALGVEFRLKDADADGEIVVANKASRAEDVECVRIQVAAEGWMAAALGAEVRGRINFSRAQLFGRVGGRALFALSRVVRNGGAPAKEVIGALHFWVGAMRRMKPRKLRVRDDRPPVILFSDGAEEEYKVTVGAVMIDLADNAIEFWEEEVPKAMVAHWRERGGHKKVIHQAELLPVLLSVQGWSSRVAGRRVFSFVDNDAAKFSIISGTSDDLASCDIVDDLWMGVTDLQTHLWVERVPSESNPADGPSRLDMSLMLALGGREMTTNLSR